MRRSLIIVHLQILFLVHIKHLQPQSQCFLIQNLVLDFDQKIISHKQRIFLRTPFHLGQLQNPPCQTQKTYEHEHIYRQYKLIFELISFVSLKENMLVVPIHTWGNNILAFIILWKWIINLPLANGSISGGGWWPSTIFPAVTWTFDCQLGKDDLADNYDRWRPNYLSHCHKKTPASQNKHILDHTSLPDSKPTCILCCSPPDQYYPYQKLKSHCHHSPLKNDNDKWSCPHSQWYQPW